jgi:RES domain-containing protein
MDARDLVSVRVNRIGPVLDLTNVEVRSDAGVDLQTLTSDEPDDLETCRTIADWARSEGYQGLLGPSAVRPDEVNLIIYIDGPVHNVDLDEGPDRRLIEAEEQH